MGGTEPEEEEEEEHSCPNVFIPMHHDKEKTKELAIAKKSLQSAAELSTT